MSRHTKQQYEDVARIIRQQPWGINEITQIAESFADLFAADNPPYCINCGAPAITAEACVSAGGRPYGKHLFEGGFDREQFLAACGLEPASG